MKVEECPSITSRLRLVLTLTIMLIIISSPVVMLVNPTHVSAETTTINSNRVDSSYYHSAPRIADTPLTSIPTDTTAPSTISQDGDFTTQAALSLTRATQTSNIVNSKSYYDIMFRTTTAGIIKTVEMDFPADTYVGTALLVEATGIGPGTITADNIDDKITYTVTNAVNIPASTKIRIQLANINNPPGAISSHTVIITTRNAANGIIDGPTSTSAYNMKQIGTADIANNAVTTPKIANGAVTTGDIADGAIVPNVIRVDSNLVSVPAQMVDDNDILCPTSHPFVMGGGYNVVSGSEEFMHATTSIAISDATGWTVLMFNSHPTDAFSFLVSAVCMAPMP